MNSQNSATTQSAPKTLPTIDPGRIPFQVWEAVQAHDDKSQARRKLLTLAISLVNAAGGLISRLEANQLHIEEQLLSKQAAGWSTTLQEQLLASSEKAINSRTVDYRPVQDMPAALIISSPFPETREITGCLTLLIVVGEASLDPFIITCQLLASAFSLHQGGQKPAIPTTGQAGLIEVLKSSLSMSTEQERLLHLVMGIKSVLNCSRVGIGLSNRQTGAEGRIPLRALSDVTKIDRRTEQVRKIEKALNECGIHGSEVVWPAETATRTALPSPVLKELAGVDGSSHIAVLPLTDAHQKTAGALLLEWDQGASHSDELRALKPLTPLLAQLFQHQPRTLGRFTEGAQKRGSRHPFGSRRTLISAGVFLAACCILLIPLPFSLNAESTAQPVHIRYVVPRYDGILEQVLVKPGDGVVPDQLLATLDGKEVDIQLANLQVEKNKAAKMRDQYLATGNTAGAQIARLDERRFQEQINLLQDKKQHLKLVSPIAGVVLTGDLKRVEGGPVSKGQTLFEIAPLESMNIEMAVQEEDVLFLKEQMETTIRFGAYPDLKWEGQVENIVPKSQLRDNANIFLAELTLDNPDNKLQPGMRGTARIKVGLRPLGWQLLRKPYYTLLHFFDRLF